MGFKPQGGGRLRWIMVTSLLWAMFQPPLDLLMQRDPARSHFCTHIVGMGQVLTQFSLQSLNAKSAGVLLFGCHGLCPPPKSQKKPPFFEMAGNRVFNSYNIQAATPLPASSSQLFSAKHECEGQKPGEHVYLWFQLNPSRVYSAQVTWPAEMCWISSCSDGGKAEQGWMGRNRQGTLFIHGPACLCLPFYPQLFITVIIIMQ